MDTLNKGGDPAPQPAGFSGSGDVVAPPAPFPTDVLARPLARFVEAVARSQVVDPAMAALPLLSAMAAAIGGARRVAIKPDWHEPCAVWTAIVAPSGSGKTPAAAPVLRAVRDRDADAVARNRRRMDDYTADLADYERALRKRKPDDPPLARPDRPALPRYHLQDVTPEQLLAQLADNPRGALMVRDELSGLFGGFGKYSEGRGASERAKYLSIWSAEHLSDDRKVSASAYVRRPLLSVFGGVQPELLFRSLSVDDCAAGLPARFLFAWPESPPRRWSDESVPATLTEKLAEVFGALYGLEMVERPTGDGAGNSGQTEWRSVDVPLTGHARDGFRRWYDETHAPRLHRSTGAEHAAYSKLPAQCGRLALVLHLSSWAAGEGANPEKPVDPEEIDEESVAHAIRLTEWFRAQADRVYGLRHEDEQQRDHRELVDLITRHGGRITARQLGRASRRWRRAADATAVLESLAKAGHGELQTRPPTARGGRPVVQFVLLEPGDEN